MKSFVITGAGVGLGRTLARKFVDEGHQVFLLGRTQSKLDAVASELGELAIAVQCDVGSPDSVRQAFANIAQQQTTIDVLINNAAVFEPYELVKGSDEQIASVVSTNLAGPMYCIRAAIPMMQSGSQIINITSESVDLDLPHLSAYQSTKAGLERLSKSLYLELQPAGIRVTNVRAGGMYEEGKTWEVDPKARMAFAKEAMARGFNLMEKPLSQFESVAKVIGTLTELPDDLQVDSISLHARKTN